MRQELSQHAEIRALNQRSIPPLVIDWVVEYGRFTRRGRADVYYLDKKGRKRLRSEIGALPYRLMKDKLNVYVVLSDDGTVITAGHRLTRIRQ